MNSLTPNSEHGAVARHALRTALSGMPSGAGSPILVPSREAGTEFRKRWMCALHDGFKSVYQDETRIAVLSSAYPASGVVKTWRRYEYLYDLTVVEAEKRSAPIHATASVPMIIRALWQVESEMGLSAVDVAEDLGKLVLGSAISKLLIVARPAAEDNFVPWIEFIRKAAEHVPNNFFLAVMPTYSTSASAREAWIDRSAKIELYKREDGRLGRLTARRSRSTERLTSRGRHLSANDRSRADFGARKAPGWQLTG